LLAADCVTVQGNWRPGEAHRDDDVMGPTVNGRDDHQVRDAAAADDDDDKFTRCRQCGELFVDPRMLPCLHTFCLHCLERLNTTTSSNVADSLTTSQDAKAHSVRIVFTRSICFANIYYASVYVMEALRNAEIRPSACLPLSLSLSLPCP